jgi:hypothetical protein
MSSEAALAVPERCRFCRRAPHYGISFAGKLDGQKPFIALTGKLSHLNRLDMEATRNET